MTVTLYHWWGSTCSRKARTALAEKGVEWESVHVDLHEFEQWEPWYVKIHPNGVVPAMDHDGRIVIESNAILEYIDETFDGFTLKVDLKQASASEVLNVLNRSIGRIKSAETYICEINPAADDPPEKTD